MMKGVGPPAGGCVYAQVAESNGDRIENPGV
jgi:hypothetical protein